MVAGQGTPDERHNRLDPHHGSHIHDAHIEHHDGVSDEVHALNLCDLARDNSGSVIIPHQRDTASGALPPLAVNVLAQSDRSDAQQAPLSVNQTAGVLGASLDVPPATDATSAPSGTVSSTGLDVSALDVSRAKAGTTGVNLTATNDAHAPVTTQDAPAPTGVQKLAGVPVITATFDNAPGVVPPHSLGLEASPVVPINTVNMLDQTPVVKVANSASSADVAPTPPTHTDVSTLASTNNQPAAASPIINASLDGSRTATTSTVQTNEGSKTASVNMLDQSGSPNVRTTSGTKDVVANSPTHVDALPAPTNALQSAGVPIITASLDSAPVVPKLATAVGSAPLNPVNMLDQGRTSTVATAGSTTDIPASPVRTDVAVPVATSTDRSAGVPIITASLDTAPVVPKTSSVQTTNAATNTVNMLDQSRAATVATAGSTPDVAAAPVRTDVPVAVATNADRSAGVPIITASLDTAPVVIKTSSVQTADVPINTVNMLDQSRTATVAIVGSTPDVAASPVRTDVPVAVATNADRSAGVPIITASLDTAPVVIKTSSVQTTDVPLNTVNMLDQNRTATVAMVGSAPDVATSPVRRDVPVAMATNTDRSAGVPIITATLDSAPIVIKTSSAQTADVPTINTVNMLDQTRTVYNTGSTQDVAGAPVRTESPVTASNTDRAAGVQIITATFDTPPVVMKTSVGQPADVSSINSVNMLDQNRTANVGNMSSIQEVPVRTDVPIPAAPSTDRAAGVPIITASLDSTPAVLKTSTTTLDVSTINSVKALDQGGIRTDRTQDVASATPPIRTDVPSPIPVGNSQSGVPVIVAALDSSTPQRQPDAVLLKPVVATEAMTGNTATSSQIARLLDEMRQLAMLQPLPVRYLSSPSTGDSVNNESSNTPTFRAQINNAVSLAKESVAVLEQVQSFTQGKTSNSSEATAGSIAASALSQIIARQLGDSATASASTSSTKANVSVETAVQAIVGVPSAKAAIPVDAKGNPVSADNTSVKNNPTATATKDGAAAESKPVPLGPDGKPIAINAIDLKIDDKKGTSKPADPNAERLIGVLEDKEDSADKGKIVRGLKNILDEEETKTGKPELVGANSFVNVPGRWDSRPIKDLKIDGMEEFEADIAGRKGGSSSGGSSASSQPQNGATTPGATDPNQTDPSSTNGVPQRTTTEADCGQLSEIVKELKGRNSAQPTPSPRVGEPAPADTGVQFERRVRYKVRRGDTLQSIARREFGNVRVAPLIHMLNRASMRRSIDGHVVLKAGMYITLPSRAEALRYLVRTQAAHSSTSRLLIGEPDNRAYFCRFGDTLVSIAAGQLNDQRLWVLIARINNLSEKMNAAGMPLAQLTRGQRLLFPTAEQVAVFRRQSQAVKLLESLEDAVDTVVKKTDSNEFETRVITQPNLGDVKDDLRLVLEVKHDGSWLPVVEYRVRTGKSTVTANSFSGRRRVLKIDLPDRAMREMAENDLTANAANYCRVFMADRLPF